GFPAHPAHEAQLGCGSALHSGRERPSRSAGLTSAPESGTYQPAPFAVVKPMLRTALILLALWASQSVRAQVNEIGITGGAFYYIGDLNPTKHYPRDTKLAGGLLFRHNMSDRWALRVQALYGTLQAYDSDSNDSLQVLRNLHF